MFIYIVKMTGRGEIIVTANSAKEARAAVVKRFGSDRNIYYLKRLN